MQDQLTIAVRDMRRHADALLATRVLTVPGDDPTAEITHALKVQASADDIIRAVVHQARERGTTWQTIGDALGVSRQAAFQRYGKPIDPRTGAPMDTTPLDAAAELARAAIQDLAHGRWALVAERFDPAMREALSPDSLAAAWTQIVATSGAFEDQGDPVVMRAGELTITNTPLMMEAGDYTARIAFRDDHTIAGLHILEAHAA